MSGRDATRAATATLAVGDETVLGRECRVFTRFLVGGLPDEYITSSYVTAHRVRPGFYGGTPFDGVLLGLARRAPLGTRLADAHSRIFAPSSLLRRKLVLLLAILETSAPYTAHIDDPGRGPRVFLPLRLAVHGILAVASLLAGTLLLLPLRLIRWHGKGRP